jgi:hypothetical protein
VKFIDTDLNIKIKIMRILECNQLKKLIVFSASVQRSAASIREGVEIIASRMHTLET